MARQSAGSEASRLVSVAGAGDVDVLERIRAVRALMLDVLPRLVRELLVEARDQYTWAEIAEAGRWGTPQAARKVGREPSDAEREAARAHAAKQRRGRIADELPGISVAEAAERLGVTPQAVYGRIKNKSLVAERVQAGERVWVRVVTDIPKRS